MLIFKAKKLPKCLIMHLLTYIRKVLVLETKDYPFITFFTESAIKNTKIYSPLYNDNNIRYVIANYETKEVHFAQNCVEDIESETTAIYKINDTVSDDYITAFVKFYFQYTDKKKRMLFIPLYSHSRYSANEKDKNLIIQLIQNHQRV